VETLRVLDSQGWPNLGRFPPMDSGLRRAPDLGFSEWIIGDGFVLTRFNKRGFPPRRVYILLTPFFVVRGLRVVFLCNFRFLTYWITDETISLSVFVFTV